MENCSTRSMRNGLSFIHNGDISDANGRNIVTNRSYPVNHSVFLSTGGRSDSAIFFAVILEYIGFGFARRGRGPGRARTAPSFHPEVQLQLHDSSPRTSSSPCAPPVEKTSPRIVEIYDEYGPWRAGRRLPCDALP